MQIVQLREQGGRTSTIADLIRNNAATKIEGRRRTPTDALRKALPGTALAAMRTYLTEAEITARNMEEFLIEARADPELREMARQQGIDWEVWEAQLEAELIEGRFAVEALSGG